MIPLPHVNLTVSSKYSTGFGKERCPAYVRGRSVRMLQALQTFLRIRESYAVVVVNDTDLEVLIIMGENVPEVPKISCGSSDDMVADKTPICTYFSSAQASAAEASAEATWEKHQEARWIEPHSRVEFYVDDLNKEFLNAVIKKDANWFVVKATTLNQLSGGAVKISDEDVQGGKALAPQSVIDFGLART